MICNLSGFVKVLNLPLFCYSAVLLNQQFFLERTRDERTKKALLAGTPLYQVSQKNVSLFDEA